MRWLLTREPERERARDSEWGRAICFSHAVAYWARSQRERVSGRHPEQDPALPDLKTHLQSIVVVTRSKPDPHFWICSHSVTFSFTSSTFKKKIFVHVWQIITAQPTLFCAVMCQELILHSHNVSGLAETGKITWEPSCIIARWLDPMLSLLFTWLKQSKFHCVLHLDVIARNSWYVWLSYS